MWKVRSGLVD